MKADGIEQKASLSPEKSPPPTVRRNRATDRLTSEDLEVSCRLLLLNCFHSTQHK